MENWQTTSDTVCRLSGKEEIVEALRQAVRRQKEISSSSADQNVVAAALSLGLSESTLYSDLLAIFIGGFHTTASC